MRTRMPSPESTRVALAAHRSPCVAALALSNALLAAPSEAFVLLLRDCCVPGDVLFDVWVRACTIGRAHRRR